MAAVVVLNVFVRSTGAWAVWKRGGGGWRGAATPGGSVEKHAPMKNMRSEPYSRTTLAEMSEETGTLRRCAVHVYDSSGDPRSGTTIEQACPHGLL